MTVTNYYDWGLQLITGRASEPALVSEGITFLEYLYFILSSYPQIESQYPPGILGFTINGRKPTDFDILKDGDEIYFTVNNYFNINN